MTAARRVVEDHMKSLKAAGVITEKNEKEVAELLSMHDGGKNAMFILGAIRNLVEASSAEDRKQCFDYGMECFKEAKYASSARIIVIYFILLRCNNLLTLENAKLFMQYIEDPVASDTHDDFFDRDEYNYDDDVKSVVDPNNIHPEAIEPEGDDTFFVKICKLSFRLFKGNLLTQTNYEHLLGDPRILKEFVELVDFFAERTFLFDSEKNRGAVNNIGILLTLDAHRLRYVVDNMKKILEENDNVSDDLKKENLEIQGAREQTVFDKLIKDAKTKMTNECNFQRVATLVSFFRANKDHPFVNSALPLVNEILEKTGMKEPKGKKK